MQIIQRGTGKHWPLLALIPLAAALVLVATLAVGRGNAADTDWSSETGWLGVSIQNIDKDLAESEELTSTEGVFVSGVVDDSPAAKAGIKKGDVIVRFDGKDVPTVRRLTRLVEWSDPGSQKEVVVVRDGKKKALTATIGTGEEPDDVLEWNFKSPDVDVETPEPPATPRAWAFSLGQLSTSRIGVSLYEMPDQLAEHFGVKEGVLIAEVEAKGPAAKAGLKAGDVILEIDHKAVSGADDVRKAIHSKKDGEIATIMVQRTPSEQKTVDVAVEESDTWSGIEAPRAFRMVPNQTGEVRRAMREAQRDFRESMRDYRGQLREDWREELQKQLDELRDQLRDLREELKDLK